MHGLQTGLNRIQCQCAFLDIVQQPFHFTLRRNQSGHIDPTACTGCTVRTQGLTHLVHRVPFGFLQTADETVAQELLNTDRIEFPSVLEGRVTDLAVFITIHLRVLSAQCLQFIEHFPTGPHLLHRVRTEQVKINLIDLMRIFSVITFRPFLRIADGTYGTQVCTRHQVTLRVILNQVRERQIGGVGMVGMTTHHETERTYFGRPQEVTVTRRLRTAFSDTLMDRTEFVHMVRLVTTRSCIQEREHTGDQERTLMVGHGIRTGEDRTGLSVHTLAVTEEQTLACRIVLIEDTSLTHKTFVYQCRITDLHTRGDNEIRALDTAGQPHRCGLVGVDRTVLQTTHAAQFGIVTDPHVLDRTAVQNPYVVSDITVIGSMRLRIRVYEVLQLLDHLRTVTIQRQDIRQTRTQFIEDRNLTTTAFVHHRHPNTVTERRLAVH